MIELWNWKKNSLHTDSFFEINWSLNSTGKTRSGSLPVKCFVTIQFFGDQIIWFMVKCLTGFLIFSYSLINFCSCFKYNFKRMKNHVISNTKKLWKVTDAHFSWIKALDWENKQIEKNHSLCTLRLQFHLLCTCFSRWMLPSKRYYQNSFMTLENIHKPQVIFTFSVWIQFMSHSLTFDLIGCIFVNFSRYSFKCLSHMSATCFLAFSMINTDLAFSINVLLIGEVSIWVVNSGSFKNDGCVDILSNTRS